MEDKNIEKDELVKDFGKIFSYFFRGMCKKNIIIICKITKQQAKQGLNKKIQTSVTDICNVCNGTGKDENLKECENCSGDGFIHNLKNINCILVDEVQFMTRKQIEELWYITKVFNIPVIGYGLRTDFKTNGFEGSIRMFELADELLEMPTICRCGKKARFNGRLIKNEYVYDGDSICIDDKEDVSYESLCGSCYLKKVRKISRDDF